MKLSEAMMLGSVTVKMEPHSIQTCALGAAGNAVGIPNGMDVLYRGAIYLNRLYHIMNEWPWLKKACVCGRGCLVAGNCVSTRFNDEVCEGKMTFEELVDYVRSIEPECGACNEFQCTCSKPEPTKAIEEVAA